MTWRIAFCVSSAIVCLVSVSGHADEGELMLSDRLDGDLDNYCVDIVGSKSRADISRGLQTHTCYGYQGEMGIDQIFDSERLADNELYMPKFDVCATMPGFEAGTKVGLSPCDGSKEQAISLTEDGRLSPLDASQMCLTAGDATRLGRGGTSRHQIKTLTLEDCDDDLAPYQQWEIRAEGS